MTRGNPTPSALPLIVEHLADDEAQLLDALVDALAENEGYRLVACAALGALHTQSREVARLRAQNQALRDELRRYVAAQVDPARRVA